MCPDIVQTAGTMAGLFKSIISHFMRRVDFMQKIVVFHICAGVQPDAGFREALHGIRLSDIITVRFRSPC